MPPLFTNFGAFESPISTHGRNVGVIYSEEDLGLTISDEIE